MSEPRITIKNGHAVTVGGVLLEATIDSVSGAFWIEQTGTVLNGDGAAIKLAAEMLRDRFRRVRPDLRFVPPPLAVPVQAEAVTEAEVVT